LALFEFLSCPVIEVFLLAGKRSNVVRVTIPQHGTHSELIDTGLDVLHNKRLILARRLARDHHNAAMFPTSNQASVLKSLSTRRIRMPSVISPTVPG
jgi:hypothetical protein